MQTPARGGRGLLRWPGRWIPCANKRWKLGRVLSICQEDAMLPNVLKIVVAGAALIAVANRAGAADEKNAGKNGPAAKRRGDQMRRSAADCAQGYQAYSAYR